jgi:hypothetical protein
MYFSSLFCRYKTISAIIPLRTDYGFEECLANNLIEEDWEIHNHIFPLKS